MIFLHQVIVSLPVFIQFSLLSFVSKRLLGSPSFGYLWMIIAVFRRDFLQVWSPFLYGEGWVFLILLEKKIQIFFHKKDRLVKLVKVLFFKKGALFSSALACAKVVFLCVPVRALLIYVISISMSSFSVRTNQQLCDFCKWIMCEQ